MNKTSDVLFPVNKESLPKKYYVYTLFSLKDYKLYTGYTTDLKRRLVEHAQGRSVATKFRTPFQLIHYEYFINEKDAKAREVFLKSGFGRKQLKEALKRTLKNVLPLGTNT